jgi:ribosomal protein S18 acetylase RimI-like enzyme
MRALQRKSLPQIDVRPAGVADLTALLEIETRVFSSGRMSRRSLRHFVSSPTSAVIVAEYGHEIAGCAVLLFRPKSDIARLYSIAVAPQLADRGVGPALLAASEHAARKHGRLRMRLEVHVGNHRAIERYRKSGYREFGRYPAYYDDRCDALRFEKMLSTAR